MRDKILILKYWNIIVWCIFIIYIPVFIYCKGLKEWVTQVKALIKQMTL